MEDHERIKHARTHAINGKLSQEQVAEACGISRVAVSLWESNDSSKRTKPTINNLKILSKVTGYSLDWIINREGLGPETHSISTSSPQSKQISGTGFNPFEIDIALVRPIYIVGTAEGGPDKEWLELGYPEGYGDEYIEGISMDNNAYGLLVSGNSMSPRMKPGEALLVEPNKECQPGDEVIVKLLDGSVLVKHYSSRRNGKISDSVNKEHDRIVVKESEIDFIHYVAGAFRAGSIKQKI